MSPQPTAVPSAILPLLAALALGFAQLLPLDGDTLELLSPRGVAVRQRLMSEQNPADAAIIARLQLPPAATRQPVSLYPASTRVDLALLVLAVGMFVLGSTLFRSPRAQRWLLGAIAVNGAALAFFGIVQKLTYNGLIYWRVPLRLGGGPFGPFVNRNNAGGFLLLCLAGALGLIVGTLSRSGGFRGSAAAEEQDRSSRVRPPGAWRGLTESLRTLDGRTLAAFFLAACIMGGIFCTLSRSATLATIGAALATVLAVFATRRWNASLAWIGLAAIAGLGLVSWVGMTGPLRARLGTLFSRTILTSEEKLPHWQEVLQSVPDFWRTGTGLGTYRFAYGLYQNHAQDLWFYHAENQYVEALVEGGVLGLGLMLSSIALMGCAGWRLLRVKSRPSTLALGVVAVFALTGQMLHGMFDFSLYIPAIVLLLALLAGAIAGHAADMASPRGWSRCLVLSHAPRGSQAIAMIAMAAVLWGGHELAQVARVEAGQIAADTCFQRGGETADTLRQAARDLAVQAEQRPDDAQLHCRLAKLWIQCYQAAIRPESTGPALPKTDPADLPEVTLLAPFHRRAYQLSLTDQPDAWRRWRDDPLATVNLLPALRHLILSRRACPLLPDVHLLIAELSGLVAEPDDDLIHLQRAERSAPSQPVVFFQTGRLAWQTDRQDAALDSWRKCLALSDVDLPQILRLAEPQLGQPQTVARLFPPAPLRLIKLAREQYGEESQAQLRDALLQRATELIRDGSFPAAEAHYVRGSALALRGDYQPAISCYAQALELQPHETRWRYELALLLQHTGNIEAAHAQIQGCLLAEPRNKGYRTLLENLNRIRTRADVTGKR